MGSYELAALSLWNKLKIDENENHIVFLEMSNDSCET